MGSQNSKFISEQQLPHQFRPVKEQPTVYESILNGTRLQKHKIDLNNQIEINYEKQIFVFRRIHADRLISAYFFEKFMPSHFCNMSYQVCFFTEYPQYSLTSGMSFPTEKCFQLLIQCLKGFQILYGKYGAFSVTFSNIFFDSHHQVKVWISSDLGKTRLERQRCYQSNEQRMITEIFRIFDQIKDQRSSRIIFSNYLRKIQQKQYKCLSFKNVIMYMVDEASKYFINRTRAKPLFELEKNQALSYNPSIVTTIKSRSPHNQNKQNAISLKTKSRTNTKFVNTCSSGQFISFENANNNDKLCKNARATHADRNKKSKRHNSQEDYKTRQIHFFKQPYNNNFCGQGIRILNTNPSINGQLSPTHQQRFQNTATLRIFRRSLDEIDNYISQTPVHNRAQTNYYTRINKNYMPMQQRQAVTHNQRKIALQIMQTQIQKQECINPTIKIPKCAYMNNQNIPKNIVSQEKRSSKTVKMMIDRDENNYALKPNYGPKQINESNLVLSNLQTLKSIINSQYSDLDSQIRDDLENLNY